MIMNSNMNFYDVFQEVLKLFPEVSGYSIIFEIFESEPGFSVGKVRRRGDSFVVKLATNLVEDDVHASFIIAHELSHILLNPSGVPTEDERWEPDFVEALDRSIEDMTCDWIAMKRLEQHYERDKKKLKRLYEVYLGAVGVEGYVALAEDMKNKVLNVLKERALDRVKELLEKYFMNIPIEALETMSPFVILGLSKYITSCNEDRK